MSEDREVEVVEPSTAIAEAEKPALPVGVQPSPNYSRAIELGHVMAQSGYFADAKEAAQAAVKIMVGMDLGVSPTAAISNIHVLEKGGRTSFIIEGKLLSSVLRQRPGYDYEIVKRDAEGCTLRFLRNGEEVNVGDGLAGGEVSFTMEDATRAELGKRGRDGGPSMYEKYPEEMLFWRCMAKGVRIHFPELLAGQPIYTEEEMGVDAQSMREQLAPPGPQPVQTEKAEELRARARELKDAITEINPTAITGARFAQMLRNAEHSEAMLQSLVEVLEGNLAAETHLKELLAELDEVDEEKMPASAKKALRERLDRTKGASAKCDKLTEALAEVKTDTDPEEGEEDGSNRD